MSGGTLATFFRFAVVGAVNTGTGLATIAVATLGFGLNAYAANGLGFVAGITVGFLLNRFWTFRSEASVAAAGPRYLLVFLVSYAVNLGILSALLALAPAYPIAAQAAALAGYSIVFYLLCRRIVFPPVPIPRA